MARILKAMFVEFSFRGPAGVSGVGDAYLEYERLTPQVMRGFKKRMHEELLLQNGIENADIIVTHHIMLDDVIKEED